MSKRALKRAAKQRTKDLLLNALNQVTQDKPVQSIGTEIATRAHSIDFLSTVLNTLPNPDPVLKKKNVDVQVYEALLYDSRVKAVVGSRKAPVKAMEWDIVGEGVDESVLDFYRMIFQQYNMTDLIGEILDAFLYGYKPLEIIWSNVDGAMIPTGFIPKPSRWFRFNDYNELVMLTTNHPYGETLPPNKFLTAKYEASYANPYGIAVLSGCFWPVTFRQNGMKFWTIFLEKYGSPFLLAHAEEGAQEDRINEVANMLDNMVSDAIAVVPKNYEVQILEAKEGKGAESSFHKTYLDFFDQEIAMAVLSTNLSTEVSGGSFAASQSHMTVRDDIIEGDQSIVEDLFTQLIKIVHGFNFLDINFPQFKLFSEEKVDKVRSERDVNLTKIGVRFKPSYLERAYNLTPDEDFEMTDPDTTTEPVAESVE